MTTLDAVTKKTKSEPTREAVAAKEWVRRVAVVDAEWSSDVFRMDEYFHQAGGQWRRSAGRAAEHRAELGQRVFRVIGPLA